MELIDGSGLGLSKPVLEFGEGLLDGIEIRAVGRQKEAVCAADINVWVSADFTSRKKHNG